MNALIAAGGSNQTNERKTNQPSVIQVIW
eukprot:SAG25_NODE_7311_length_489_cov_0.520513_1_plen_28_part_10